MDDEKYIEIHGIDTIGEILEDIKKNTEESELINKLIDNINTKQAIKLLSLALERQRQYIKIITEELLLRKFF